MAQRRDPVLEELKVIRRRFSERLHQAFRKGTLEDEVATIDLAGRRTFRELMNGSRNGRSGVRAKPRRNGRAAAKR